jgi:hypothetical protein
MTRQYLAADITLADVLAWLTYRDEVEEREFPMVQLFHDGSGALLEGVAEDEAEVYELFPETGDPGYAATVGSDKTLAQLVGEWRDSR